MAEDFAGSWKEMTNTLALAPDIHLPPPGNLAAFELGDTLFPAEEERKMASGLYQQSLFEMLARSEVLLAAWEQGGATTAQAKERFDLTVQPVVSGEDAAIELSGVTAAMPGRRNRPDENIAPVATA